MSRWKQAEILIVRQCAGKMSVAAIGQLIGRTGKAVRTKAQELHITQIKQFKQPKTHTGVISSTKGEIRVRIYETEQTWYVSKGVMYYKSDGRRQGNRLGTTHRLLLDTIRPIRPIRPLNPGLSG